MSKQTLSKNQGFSQIVILLLVAVLIGFTGYLIYTNQQVIEQLGDMSSNQTQEAEESSGNETSNEGAEAGADDEDESELQESYTEETDIEGQLRYVSPELGVSFEYAESVELGQVTQEFAVTEAGDKIYIYDQSLVDETGEPVLGAKYVEVMSKDSSLNLNEALSSRFNLDTNDKCRLNELQGSYDLDPTYETAVIGFVPEEGVEYGLPEMMEAVEENCPTPYTPVNGMAYFMMNPAAAGKMAFVSVGQDCTPSGEEGECWHETIRLFE